MEQQEKKNIGTCPKCGKDVYKTCRGWKCGCGFTLNGIIGNRRLTDEEASELITAGRILLDGFATQEGKVFSTVLVLKEDGTVAMDSKVAKCPRCGGDIHVGTKAFNCSNFARENDPCPFVVWRNISGHSITLPEIKEICENGFTATNVDLFGEDGTVFHKRFALTPEKDKVVKI